MDVDYGPLAGLIGTWKGDKGMDVSPEPDGTQENPYFETITFEAAGALENAERQKLSVVRYLQIVRRKSNGEVFHDQTGYWMWDPATHTVAQSISVPRAVCVLAGAVHTGGSDPSQGPVTIQVAAQLGDPDWGIVQSPFMRDNAKTVEFRHTLTIEPDRVVYAETTVLEIYGRSFDHTDENELVRA